MLYHINIELNKEETKMLRELIGEGWDSLQEKGESRKSKIIIFGEKILDTIDNKYNNLIIIEMDNPNSIG